MSLTSFILIWLIQFHFSLSSSFIPSTANKLLLLSKISILIPLLANVCLNELDHTVEEMIVEFFRPCKFDYILYGNIQLMMVVITLLGLSLFRRVVKRKLER
jgi:hypothetical protein